MTPAPGPSNPVKHAYEYMKEKNYAAAYDIFIDVYENQDPGSAWAALELSNLYANGFHVKQDMEKAFEYCKIAAQSKHYCDAWERLGEMYKKGLGTKADEEEGHKWTMKTAGYLIDQQNENVDVPLTLAESIRRKIAEVKREQEEQR